MASSDIDICSQALELLGIPAISSFDENPVAATCQRFYDTTINYLLGRYPWRFAQKTAQLDRQANDPVAHWKFQYTFPTDIVAPGVYALFESNRTGTNPIKDYTLGLNDQQQAVILSDRRELWMVYTIRLPEAQWPPHFYRLAVFAMAAILAIPLTEDPDKDSVWQAKAYGTPQEGGEGGFLANAKRIDAQQAPAAPIQDYTLMQAHQGGLRG